MASPRKKTSTSKTARPDAISHQKDDYGQVEDWFSQFERAKSASKKRQLAARICDARISRTIH